MTRAPLSYFTQDGFDAFQEMSTVQDDVFCMLRMDETGATGHMHKADWNHNRTGLLTDGVDPAQLLISVSGGVAYVWLGHIKWRRCSTTASCSRRR